MKKNFMILLLSALGLTTVGKAQTETPVLPDPPAKISVTSVSLKEVKFSVEANAANDDIMIVMTTGRDTTADGKSIYEGAFDSIGPDDPVEKKRGATTVLYVGAAGNDLSVPVTLENNRVYYFGAFSKTADGVSETVAVPDAKFVLTPAGFPFKDNMKDNFSPDVAEPFKGMGAYEKNAHVKITKDGAATDFENNSLERQEAVFYVPELVFPTDSNVRVYVSYSGWPSSPSSRDSVVLEISRDGGETFAMLAHNRQFPNMIFNSQSVIVDDCLGKTGQLRLRVVCQSYNVWNLTGVTIKAEHMVFCPNPGKPSVNMAYGSVDGAALGVKWGSGNYNETEWHVSYAVEPADGAEAVWSEMEKVTQRFYDVTGLEDRQLCHVRVQAICGQKSDGSRHLSEWVEVRNLQAGRKLPFTEDFNGMEIKEGGYPRTKYVLIPTFWNSNFEVGKDAFPENWTLRPASDPTRGGKIRYLGLQYKKQDVYTQEAADGSIAYNMHYKTTTGGFMPTTEHAGEPNWFSTPLVQLLKKTQLRFDIAYGKFVEGVLTAVPEAEIKAEHKVALWVSTDSGKTVNTMQPVWEADGTALAALHEGKTVEVDLSAYRGQMISVVFGVLGTKGENADKEFMLYFDNIGFSTLISPVEGLAVSAVTSKEATLTWEADADVAEWLVKIDSGSLEAPRFHAVNDNRFVIDGLMPEQAYKASVSHIYTVEGKTDTAEWRSVTFKTSKVCAVPSDLTVERVTTTAAHVGWKGASDVYQVAWADETAATWNYRSVEKDTLTISGLEPKTRYQFKVRGICAAGDSGAWSEPCRFETEALPIPCNAPTNLRVEDLTHESATLLWDAEAAEEAEKDDIQAYILRYRVAPVPVWDSVKDLKEKKYGLGGLTSETAYVWAVQTVCASGRYSGWAAESDFETLEEKQDTVPGRDTTAVENLKLASGLYVAAAQGQIYVMNPKAVRIDAIRIYSTAGRRLAQYAIRSNDNVVLTTEIRKRVAVVEVESEGRFIRFKLLL